MERVQKIRNFSRFYVLFNRLPGVDDKEDMDFWRKRVMASVGGWLRLINIEASGEYVKGIALRAAGGEIKSFNAIPHKRLRELYFAFVDRQNALKRIEKMEKNEFNRIVKDHSELLRASGIEVELKIRQCQGDC